MDNFRSLMIHSNLPKARAPAACRRAAVEQWSEDRLEEEDWDEDDWERFLRQYDTRMAKYQELFETLEHHPQRDRLIAKEMGWDRVLGECDNHSQDCSTCAKQQDCEIFHVSKLWADAISAAGAGRAAGEVEHDTGDLREITAYREGHAFALEVDSCFNRVFEAAAEPDEEVLEALSLSSLVPAKIAGGHGMGYERDSLCGNIAYCKRALKCLGQCVEALMSIRSRNLAATHQLDALVGRAWEVEKEVKARIDDLRSHVWWA